MWRKSSPEHGENLQAKNDKAPEDEKMHPTGGLLASDKFLLAKGVDEYRLQALSDVIKAVDRPSGKQEPTAVLESAHKQPHSNEHDQGKKPRRHSSVPFTGVSPPRRGISTREALGFSMRIGGEYLSHTVNGEKDARERKAFPTLDRPAACPTKSLCHASGAAGSTAHFI